MASPDQFLIYGIDPRGDGVDFNDGIATNGHEPFSQYSRKVTLADTNALSLPGGVEGIAMAKDGADSAVFTVFSDGTVNILASSSGASAPGGGGDIQIGDIAGDDSTQIRNDSGTDSDLTAFLFYRT